MNYFTKQLKWLIDANPWFDGKEVSYIGREAFVKIPENRLARLELREYSTHDHYNELCVTILEIRQQEIAKIRLLFDDYFEERKDNPPYYSKPYIGYYREYEWYGVPTSRDIERLSCAASNYIQLFW